MTASAAAWQLDRLSTSAREAAESASLAAGLPLSSWLTRLIGETCAAEGVELPSEPPKIVEFAREARERSLPLAARLAAVTGAAPPSPAPVPTATPLPAAPPLRSPAAASSSTASPSTVPGALMLPVAAMAPANLGTRRGEDVPDTLLSDIATRGVRQPLLVRRISQEAERYEIICGHRRWRAAQRAGLALVPATVGAHDDGAAILASLTENLQLGTLSPIEEAQAYLRLLTQCVIDASVLTAAIGCDRRHIVQSMRLLGLPPLVRHLIASGALSRDHAYLLLEAPQPEALADAILAENLSVEAVRQRIGSDAADTSTGPTP